VRIALISFIEDRSTTGMGKWSHEMAAALRGRGHTVDLWFDSQFPLVKRLGARAAVLLAPLALARRLVARRQDYDVVVVHEPLGVWWGLLRRIGLRGLPAMVCMCHNVESRHAKEMVTAARIGLSYVSLSSRLKGALVRRWQSDGTIRLADAVACLSTRDERYIASKLGVAPSRIFRLVNGAAPGDGGSRPRDPKRVLFVGGWLDVKGKRVLPRIAQLVVETDPEVRFTLVGTGLDEREVLADFDEKTRRHVTVVRSIEPAAGMWRLYAEHSLFLMPSLSEGSPLALIEAMSAGLAVVATGVGGVADLIQSGETGLLFEAANPAAGAEAITALLKDPQDAMRLAEAARVVAASLTWSRTAEQLELAVLAASGAIQQAATN
jgi:glycosyltransferase involved in cell wall biosynthesis